MVISVAHLLHTCYECERSNVVVENTKCRLYDNKSEWENDVGPMGGGGDKVNNQCQASFLAVGVPKGNYHWEYILYSEVSLEY